MSDVAISMSLLDRVTGGLRVYEDRVDSLHRKQRQYTREALMSQRQLEAGYRRIGTVISALSVRVAGAGRSIFTSLQNATRATIFWGTAAAAAAAGGGAALLRHGIKLNEQMERYRITLTSVMKSQEKANAQILWMIRYAERTPFDVQGLVGASAQLEAFGINSKKWLPLLGDLAATFGGTTEQVQELVEAMGRLRAGLTGIAFRSLRRFSISHSDIEHQGGKFNKAGQFVGDPQTAIPMVENVIRQRFGGMMERLLTTWTGIFSNLQDMFTNILRETTNPLFKSLKNVGGVALRTLDTMRDSGIIQRMAGRLGENISNVAGRAGNFLTANVVDPLLGGEGFKGVASRLFEQVKAPTLSFIKWFASTFAEALMSAIRALMSSSEGRQLAGAGLLWRYGGDIISGAGSLAAGAGTFLAGRKIARAVGSRGGALPQMPKLGPYATPLMVKQAEESWAAQVGTGATGEMLGGGISRYLPMLSLFGLAAGTGALVGTAAHNAMNPLTATNPLAVAGRWMGTKYSEWANGPVNELFGDTSAWGQSAHARGIQQSVRERFGKPGSAMLAEMTARNGRVPTMKEVEQEYRKSNSEKTVSNAQELAGELVGVMQVISQFGKVARDEVFFVGGQLSEMLGGLSKDFMTAEERIATTTSSLFDFGDQINTIYSSVDQTAKNAYRNPSTVKDATDAIVGQQAALMGVRRRQAEAEMSIVLERYRLTGESTERNKSLLGKFSEVIDDPMEVARLRSMAKAGMRFNLGYSDLSTRQLLEVNSATGGIIDPAKLQERLGNVFIGKDRQLESLVSRTGGFSQDGTTLHQELEAVADKFRLLSEKDIAQMDLILNDFENVIPAAFQEGSDLMKQELRRALSVSAVEITDALVKTLNDSMRALAKELAFRQTQINNGDSTPTGY